ncbi:hypothetical protein VNO78_15415 [Psophocarpus tetragonolobus]|uniref:Cytochrome P450 n=1 Tax=Psophocarpus tetragonolobus TaxID=3891 RepID=A0AAN9XJR3_PSOTE
MDLSNSASGKSHEFKNIIRVMMEEAGRPNVADFFPFLRPLDPQRVLARRSIYVKKLFKIIDGIIEQRVCSRASKTDSNDVLDSLLNNSIDAGSLLSRNDMIHLFMDLLVAGIDTTSNTVEWIMAELLHNPDKLTKARRELSQAMGKDVTIEESHILELPFLRAVVPKNAQVLVNVWAIGRDPTIWKNPEMFMPERFLESEIDFKGHDFELIPFGTGKRICPGLPLAHRSMHLMVASLVHNFELELVDGLTPENMNMNEQYGLTLKKAQPLRVQPISIKQD